MKRIVVLAVAGAAACAAAAEESEPPYAPPPEACEPPSRGAPYTFTACSTGSGVFGRWSVGADGLPAYDYGLDQHADPRARWDNTEERDRRDHWASFGNARITATISNDGLVEVTTQDRGVTYLNKVDEGTGGWGGGISFLDDGEATWTTAYRWRPRGARTTRRFGSGYAESSTTHRDVVVVRRTFAPNGDHPYLVDEVTIENRSGRPRELRHYEYWDVRRRPIETDWLVSGRPLSAVPGAVAAHRDGRNAMFEERVAWDPAARLLGLRRAHAAGLTPPPREAPSAVEHYPGEPFLAVVEGDATDVYTDDARFFGGADPSAPQAVVARAPGELAAADPNPRSGLGQPRMFAVRSDLRLAPGERKTLRFAYGYAPFGEPWPDLGAARAPDAFGARAEDLRRNLLYFVADAAPELHRELAWHASQLEASVGYREYWGRHVVPQGSAYLYLHGADGALRDTALFSMPLVYTHPELAREQLLLAMGLAFAEDRRFTYAFQGHGVLDDALGVHARPSDLDLFFLLAMNEYLGATGDVALLDERVSYWPRAPENETTVYEHLRSAVLHLLDDVGFGEHGLIRIGTGDWSDGVVFRARDRALAIEKGESVPNSQMALAVLPAAAALLEARDPALAARIRALLPGLAAAVEGAWAGSFYGRAYFGDGELHGADHIDLEPSVWPLIGPLADSAAPRDDARLAALFESVASELDDPSPVGATNTPGADCWPAVAQLVTWGYTRFSDERAFRHLVKMSLANRARVHPEVWFQIWSGPDGASSTSGHTWASPVTPMTDYPTMNNNVHAMALLAALRVAGVEARPDGLAVFPHVPDRRLALRSALVDLDLEPTRLRLTWRPAPGVPRTLRLTAPRGATLAAVRVDGAPVDAGATTVTLPITAAPGGVAVEADLR